MNERWYDKTVRQIEEKLNTDSNTGLSAGVLKSRQKTDRMNVIFPVNHHSFDFCFKKALSEPSLMLLLIVALFAALFERNVVSYVIISMVAFNILMTVFMYRKSYQIFEDMGRLSMPTTKVLRNGKLFLVKSEQLVEGDVIFLSSGDMVPADARLVEADGLQVLEVNITGEIKPAEKDPFFLRYTHDVPAAQQANMVFASTIVLKGSAKAICCYTGEDTLVCRLKKNTKLVQQDKIKAILFTKKYSKNVSLLSIVMIFALIILQLTFGSSDISFFDVFLTALAYAAASSAEFHILSAYVIVANGLFSAVKQNKHINSGALIKNISKTEELKDISCLLVHKEGAFSIKDIRAEKVYVNNTLYTDGDVHFAENAASVLRFALISTGLYGARKIIKNNLNNDNIYSAEEEAIINLAQKCKVYNINLDKNYPIIEHLSRGDSSRFETTLVNSKNGYVVACRGSLDEILSVCTHYRENGKIYPFNLEKKADIISEAVKLSRKSNKIVGVSSKKTHYNTLRRIISCQSEMVFEGFIAIKERILPGVARNIADCQAAGMKIIMLCDDIGEHNKTLAESIGVIKSREEVMTGSGLNGMRDELFRTNISMYKLYENLSIYQKRKLLTFLHEEGEKVGVLARNLDEIILLKESDVGFVQSTTLSGKLDKAGIDMAMAKNTNSPILIKNVKDVNKTGSEALKFIADVIVSDADRRGNGGFNAVLSAIYASRLIYKNLVKFVKYLFTNQVARLVMILYMIFSSSRLINPQQIMFSGIIVDFIAMIIMAFESTGNRNLLKKDGFDELSNIYKSLPLSFLSGVAWGGSLIILPLILKLLNVNAVEIQSAVVFTGYILSQIAVLNEHLKDDSIFKTGVRFNRAHLLMFVTVVGFFVAAYTVPAIANLFEITFPGWILMSLSLIPTVMVIAVYEIQKAFIGAK